MKTEICFNCGADKGLHHYEDSRCPKNGMEEPNINKPQLFQDTHFEDSGERKLRDAAPDLLKALSFYVQICGNTAYQISRETAQEMYDMAQSAIKKATQ